MLLRRSAKPVFLLWLMAATLSADTLLTPVWSQQPTLKGRIEEQNELLEQTVTGQVTDAQTGKPLPQAEVSVPDRNLKTRTDSGGWFSLPLALGEQPLIMSVEKPGYQPFSISIRKDADPRFRIGLRKLASAIVLDTELHHLGDNSYNPLSSGAMAFRANAEGPRLRIPFVLNKRSAQTGQATLKIGSIIGLDTPMSHYLSRNPLEATASPLLVKLNNTVIARIQVNGDNQRVKLPANLLRIPGENVLEIEAGYHFPEPNRRDYDDMELIHLTLEGL